MFDPEADQHGVADIPNVAFWGLGEHRWGIGSYLHGLFHRRLLAIGGHGDDQARDLAFGIGHALIELVEARHDGGEVGGLAALVDVLGDDPVRLRGDVAFAVGIQRRHEERVRRDLDECLTVLVGTGELELGEGLVRLLGLRVNAEPAGALVDAAVADDLVVLAAGLGLELLERDGNRTTVDAGVDDDELALLVGELHDSPDHTGEAILEERAVAGLVLERAGGSLLLAVGGRRVRRRARVRRRRAALGLGRTRQSGIRPHDFGFGAAAGESESGENRDEGDGTKVAVVHGGRT